MAPRSAVRVSTPHFSLLSFPALPPNAGSAVVVSKKAIPLAVKRHGIKRRLFPFMRKYGTARFAYVMQVRKGADALTRSELVTEMESLYGKLGHR